MTDWEKIVYNKIEEAITLKTCLKHDISNLITIAKVLEQAFRRGNKAFIFGNGGSAADAQHIAAELTGQAIS
jgi:D-sedoheptulose 7-phosphate isomerase